jgi:hypothetical protein
MINIDLNKTKDEDNVDEIRTENDIVVASTSSGSNSNSNTSKSNTLKSLNITDSTAQIEMKTDPLDEQPSKQVNNLNDNDNDNDFNHNVYKRFWNKKIREPCMRNYFKVKKPANLETNKHLAYYRNNFALFNVILIYLMIQIVLIIVQYSINKTNETNIFFLTAKMSGVLLSFNSCLVVILMLRNLWTWVRTTLVGRMFLPIDHFCDIQKYIGILIIVFSIVHTLAHSINFCKCRITL